MPRLGIVIGGCMGIARILTVILCLLALSIWWHITSIFTRTEE